MALLAGNRRVVRRWIAIVLLVAGWGAPLSLLHAADDDLLCTAAIGIGQGTTRIETPSAQRAPEHCVICHAARSFRADLPEGRLSAAGVVRDAIPLRSSLAAYIPSEYRRLPARAPPVA